MRRIGHEDKGNTLLVIMKPILLCFQIQNLFVFLIQTLAQSVLLGRKTFNIFNPAEKKTYLIWIPDPKCLFTTDPKIMRSANSIAVQEGLSYMTYLATLSTPFKIAGSFRSLNL